MWLIFFFLSILSAFIYIFLLTNIISVWNHRKEKTNVSNIEEVLPVSVIIAARNESKTILSCVNSILESNYPKDKLQIIVVDDHSTDDTSEKLEKYAFEKLIQYFKLPENLSGKKQAITYGVQNAIHEIIMLTDADCLVPKFWIQNTVNKYIENKNLVATTGFVVTGNAESLLARFQSLDFISTMAITYYGFQKNLFYLANGANLSFRKDVFLAINGYAKNQKFASGDDVFLINELANKYPHGMLMNDDLQSTVWTKHEDTWANLFTQRKRWATKSKYYANVHLLKLQGYVFGFTFFILINFALVFYSNGLTIFSGMTMLFVKAVMDYLFLSKIANDFKAASSLKYFLFSFGVYIVHILYSGLNALMPSTFLWKGRKTS